MPASVNDSHTWSTRFTKIEEYAKGADITFNGKSCIGCWVGFDTKKNTYITYRPAGMASGSTTHTTATVEINFAGNKNVINNGSSLKLKFPESDH